MGRERCGEWVPSPGGKLRHSLIPAASAPVREPVALIAWYIDSWAKSALSLFLGQYTYQ